MYTISLSIPYNKVLIQNTTFIFKVLDQRFNFFLSTLQVNICSFITSWHCWSRTLTRISRCASARHNSLFYTTQEHNVGYQLLQHHFFHQYWHLMLIIFLIWKQSVWVLRQFIRIWEQCRCIHVWLPSICTMLSNEWMWHLTLSSTGWSDKWCAGLLYELGALGFVHQNVNYGKDFTDPMTGAQQLNASNGQCNTYEMLMNANACQGSCTFVTTNSINPQIEALSFYYYNYIRSPACFIIWAHWTICRHANSRIAQLQTSQLADWSTHGSCSKWLCLKHHQSLYFTCIKVRGAKYTLKQENTRQRVFT